MLRKNDYHGFFPEWIDESFAMRTNLRERLRDFLVKREDGKRPAAMRALKSNIWTALFEGYDPVATRLNLEVRHPFIDLRLVEYLLAIPAVPWCVDKHILRCAMKNKLPEAVLNRHKTGLAGDPALQLVRRASVRWLDSFEVNPQLRAFVNLDRRRPVAEEETADRLWASLRVFALNYWLTNSQPAVRRKSETTGEQKQDLNRLNSLNMETMHGT
jgi:asparagine synthase (glutamine-hydrolysing)